MDYQLQTILFPMSNESLFVSEFCNSFSSKSRKVLPQIRNAYILHIVTKGCAKFNDANVERGEAFLLPKNVLYTFQFDSEFNHYWFGFNGEGVENLLNSFNIPTNKRTYFKIDNIDELETFLKTQLDNLSQTKRPNEALSTLLYCFPHLLQSKSMPHSNYVQQAKRFIDSNYQYNISLELVAHNVNLTEKYLCRLFKKFEGISPQEYLIKTRLQKAREFLLNTNMLIKEIADNTGFSSQFSFATAYKKYYGLTPTEQRQCIKKEMQ